MARSELQHFERIIDSFDKPEVKNNITRCWSKMSELRSNSLCSICSGRHKLFFVNQKALISEETCTDILEICLSSFNHILDFIQGMKIFATTLMMKKNYFGFGFLRTSINNIVRVTDAIKKENINEQIHKYMQSAKKNKHVCLVTLWCTHQSQF